jgi:phospholipid transport system transporter-binding protein
MTASYARQDDALVFTGALDRAAVVALWPRLRREPAGVKRLDLAAVTLLDSAGLAMLAELAQARPGLAVAGSPPGLEALRAAYRLRDNLSFAA